MSVMTVSVMLSPSDARSGGGFQTRRLGPNDDPQSYDLDLGDGAEKLGPAPRGAANRVPPRARCAVVDRTGAHRHTHGPGDLLLLHGGAGQSARVLRGDPVAGRRPDVLLRSADLRQENREVALELYGEDLSQALRLLETSVECLLRGTLVHKFDPIIPWKMGIELILY